MVLHPAFNNLKFRNPPEAETYLRSVLEPERAGLAEHLGEALAQSADPDRVLVRMDHFLRASEEPEILLDFMSGSLRFTRLLCVMFDCSQYLTDLVCRNPEYVMWLISDAELDRSLDKAALLQELRGEVAAQTKFSDKCAALRRFKRREMLRIGARDVFAYASVPSVTGDLATLADVMIEVALESAAVELDERFGPPMAVDSKGDPERATFVVLGMGKLGGRELNFSSDVDLIFVYSDEGETAGGGGGTGAKTCSNSEYFHRLGELVIKALSEQTGEGHIFRVDMRLRPHGRMGPLAVSLESTVYYYEIQGQAWERQALIKARPVAGCIALGKQFIERTRPFVFPRYFDDETLEEIRESKGQLEAQVADKGHTELEVKLGPGGIRDIEFTVQMLQMLNGGANEELRSPHTLDAINALGRSGLLSAFEALTLSRNYIFLRGVEHRLQIEGSQQRHVLPQDPEVLTDFSKRLGYQSGEAFMVGYRDRAKETRKILERFFATEGSGNLWISELLNPQSDGADGIERLVSMGFHEGKRARAQLVSLCGGSEERPHSSRVRQQFREVVPGLLESLVRAPDPDETLLRLGQLLANLRAPSVMYDILKHNPQLCDALVTLVSNSHYLADFIIHDPGLFETFGYAGALDEELTRDALDEQLALLRGAYSTEGLLYRLRNAETLRVGMRELLGKVDVLTVGLELTLLADLCVREVLEESRAKVAERYGPTSKGFAVLGLGKLGGMEMGYGSDLDLVFVYDSQGEMESGMSAGEYFAAVATQFIRRMKEHTRYGLLYDVDSQLRPDGKKGTLTVSDGRLESYYREDAQAWERLALVKVRAIAGDDAFSRQVAERALDCAFEVGLTKADLDSIEDIRQRISAQASILDIKKGEGGIAEIEFAIRLLQIRHGKEAPELRRGDVLGALAVLREAELIGEANGESLKDAYLLLRRIENRIRVWKGRSVSVLPKDVEQQRELAMRLGMDGDIAEITGECRKRVHEIYLATLDRVAPQR